MITICAFTIGAICGFMAFALLVANEDDDD